MPDPVWPYEITQPLKPSRKLRTTSTPTSRSRSSCVHCSKTLNRLSKLLFASFARSQDSTRVRQRFGPGPTTSHRSSVASASSHSTSCSSSCCWQVGGPPLERISCFKSLTRHGATPERTSAPASVRTLRPAMASRGPRKPPWLQDMAFRSPKEWHRPQVDDDFGGF